MKRYTLPFRDTLLHNRQSGNRPANAFSPFITANIRIVISPVIVFFLRNLSVEHFFVLIAPLAKHNIQPRGVLVIVWIKIQRDRSVASFNPFSVSIFQRKHQMKQAERIADLGNTQSERRYIQRLCYCTDNTFLRLSCTGFVLSDTNVGALFGKADKQA